MKNTEVMEVIRSSADDLGPPGKDKLYGYGLINVNTAIRSLKPAAQEMREEKPETIGGLLNKFFLRLRQGFE